MKTIDEIRKLGADLSAETDALNVAIADAERALLSTRLGTIGRAPLPDGRGTLVFRKTEQGWGLYVELGDRLTPLRSSPRDTRVAAVPLLPTILESMTYAAEALEAQMREARSTTDAFAASTRVDGADVEDVEERERDETLGPGQVRVDVVLIFEGDDATRDALSAVDDALDGGQLQDAIGSIIEDRDLDLSIVSTVCR